jgi:hypothetical protein
MVLSLAPHSISTAAFMLADVQKYLRKNNFPILNFGLSLCSVRDKSLPQFVKVG